MSFYKNQKKLIRVLQFHLLFGLTVVLPRLAKCNALFIAFLSVISLLFCSWYQIFIVFLSIMDDGVPGKHLSCVQRIILIVVGITSQLGIPSILFTTLDFLVQILSIKSLVFVWYDCISLRNCWTLPLNLAPTSWIN